MILYEVLGFAHLPNEFRVRAVRVRHWVYPAGDATAMVETIYFPSEQTSQWETGNVVFSDGHRWICLTRSAAEILALKAREIMESAGESGGE